jgi:hypothetical protein
MLVALSVFASKSRKQVALLSQGPIKMHEYKCSWGNPKWKEPRGSKLETYAQGGRGGGLKKERVEATNSLPKE